MVKTEYSIAESAMGLNIQNPETYELAKELAELTGESMTTAITRALEERLQRLRHDHRTDREARMARVRHSLPISMQRAAPLALTPAIITISMVKMDFLPDGDRQLSLHRDPLR